MAKSITVNSEESLQEAIEELTKRYEKYHSGRIELFFGARRSVDQNRMFFEQYTRIGKHLYGGDTVHARRECKLTCGIPILRRDNPEFARMYDKVVKPHPYAIKLQMMDYLPVTSSMTVAQGVEYTNTVFDTYAMKGIDWEGLDVDPNNESLYSTAPGEGRSENS